MEWYTTDDLQWCRKYDKFDRAYQFVQVVWLDTVSGDEGYPDKEYTVVTGIVDLDDYSEEDIKTEISCYYDSIQQMCDSYNTPFECWKELDQVIAECIFESWENFSSHGMFTEEEAIKFAEKYMEKENKND